MVDVVFQFALADWKLIASNYLEFASNYCRKAIESVDSFPERRHGMDTTTYASVAMLPKCIAQDHARFVRQDLDLLPLDLSMIKR